MRFQSAELRCSARWVALFGLACFLKAAICASGWCSEARRTPVVKAISQAAPAVVNIRGEKTLSAAAVTAAAESGRRVNGMGTGVIIDARGYIVTNFHVIDGVREIHVTLANQEKYTAKSVARDLETDLAIIKIDAPKPLSVITVGNSSDLLLGESVIAIGNAFGYEHTVSLGIVSALHRAVQVNDAQYYQDLIQTDAPINPGNSGGPLLNIDGEMIGLNVAVRAGAQGIGFAIPVDRVMTVLSDMIASQNAKKFRFGLALETKPSVLANGVVVASVESDSPASKAGFQAGDVLESVNGIAIARPTDFHRAMIEFGPDTKFDASVRRGADGDKKDAKQVALNGTLSSPGKPRPAKSTNPAWDVLGLELKPISADDFQQTHENRYRGGLTVLAVRPNSPADAQGIRSGDVLVGMHVWETVSLDNISYILGRPDFTTINPLKFYILRGNTTLYGFMPVAMKTTVRE